MTSQFRKARSRKPKRHMAAQQDEGAMNQTRPVGLREMTLTETDVAELRRRIEHPSAKPKIPLREVQEEEADDLY